MLLEVMVHPPCFYLEVCLELWASKRVRLQLKSDVAVYLFFLPSVPRAVRQLLFLREVSRE